MRLIKFFLLTIITIFFIFNISYSGNIPPHILGAERSLAPMLKDVIPAVVNISVNKKSVSQIINPLLNDPFFRQFFPNFKYPNKQKKQTIQSIGSGVIINSKKGYIVTNHHVIEGANEIFITLKDGRRLKAKKIGSDPETDIALLAVKAKNLVSIPFVNIEKLRVGDFVIAIGNPFGLGQTVTSGIVSAVERSGLGIENYENFIQTDASINPGNSGGALINLNGELIGINTAIVAPQKGNVGIGFAIPADMVKAVTKQLADTGNVKRGEIGIYLQNLTQEITRAFNVDKNTKGVLITNVIKGSPAHLGGLKRYDIVTSFNGKQIKNAAGLKNLVGITPIGKKIKLGIIRNRKVKIITIKISNIKKDYISEEGSIYFKGTTFAEIDERGSVKIVIVSVEQNTKAWEKNLQKGDIVEAVNRIKVHDLSDLQKFIEPNSDAEVLLTIKRKNMFIFVLL